MTPVKVYKQNILPIPDYRSTRGCTPTSAAMVLKYDFSSALSIISPNDFIQQLALYMETSPEGITVRNFVPDSIKSVMSLYIVNVNTSLDDADRKTTYSSIITDIDRNKPLMCFLFDSTQTAPSYPYPKGFGDHTVAVNGYVLADGYNFIVVHDTGGDGDIYCDYNSSSLGRAYFLHIS